MGCLIGKLFSLLVSRVWKPELGTHREWKSELGAQD